MIAAGNPLPETATRGDVELARRRHLQRQEPLLDAAGQIQLVLRAPGAHVAGGQQRQRGDRRE